ncbi:FMN-dependent NADH-azoreductase [Mesorhizobium sp. M0659]|uniref:FMN-dependent NADH-azoreductase n=1 Tax=Mesorhizobium sp. M0659 TaxID=2956980 RepID=UPI00333D322E
MHNILVINSSVSGNDSVSRLLVADVVAAVTRLNPGVRVTERDLGAKPVPHLTADNVEGVRGSPATDEEHQSRKLSDQLLGELRAADTIIFGAPMYNFGLPTGLRAWFDYVLRAGETFSYSEAGPKGLLVGRRAIVVESRGGFYSDGPSSAIDFQEPYILHLLGFMGITDVTFIRAEKIGFGPEAREEAIAGAREEIVRLARRVAALAA